MPKCLATLVNNLASHLEETDWKKRCSPTRTT